MTGQTNKPPEEELDFSSSDLVDCDWCGAVTRIVWVHGHGQCLACGRNISPCCDGATNQV